MKTLTIGQVVGHTFLKPDGSYRRIVNIDPYNKLLFWDGLSVFHNAEGKVTGTDPGGGMMSWDEVKQKYDVEILPTAEEAEMIERGRLGLQVQIKAKEFVDAVEKWLTNEKAR